MGAGMDLFTMMLFDEFMGDNEDTLEDGEDYYTEDFLGEFSMAIPTNPDVQNQLYADGDSMIKYPGITSIPNHGITYDDLI